MKFNEGDEVYWTDPDNNISSGLYKIIECTVKDGDYTIYLISNGHSEVEVYQHELS